MPRIYHRMESTGYHILNVIVNEVVNGILDKIDALRYVKNAIYILHSFSSYSSSSDRSGTISLIKDRCDVNAKFVLDPQAVPWPNLAPYSTPAYGLRSDLNGNHRCIFADTDTYVHLEEYTTPAAIDMDFTLTFQTFDAAMRVFDMLKILNVGSVSDAVFDLSYGYPLTNSMMQMLMAVFQTKTGYTGDFIDYLKQYQKNPINFDIRKQQLTADRADVELMVRCQQLMCQGLLTFDQSEPTVIRENNLPGSYTLEFNFKIQFGRPTMVVGILPVITNNQLLPYYLFEKDLSTDNPYVSGQFQDPWMDPGILMNYKHYIQTNQLIRFPSYDDWQINDTVLNNFSYKPFIIGAFTLDDTVTTIDLLHLDDVTMNPITKEMMLALGSEIFGVEGIFNVSVIADGIRLSSSLLSIDDNLVVTINATEKSAHYYLVLSEMTNIQFLNPKWYPIILKYRYFFGTAIMRNIDFMVTNGYFNITTKNNYINFLNKLKQSGNLASTIRTLIINGDATGEILQYINHTTFLADYTTHTRALNTNPTVPTGTDTGSVNCATYMNTMIDITSRSLYNAFIEQGLLSGALDLDTIPDEYLRTPDGYPYGPDQGGFRGFSTPLRVLNYHYRSE